MIPLVELTAAEVRLRGNSILGDITFSVKTGEKWHIAGRNGSGKSTLIRLLKGDLWPENPESRHFEVNGRRQISPLGFREHCSLISAGDEKLLRRLYHRRTGTDIILSAGASSVFQSGFPLAEIPETIMERVRQFSLEGLLNRQARDLSDGELRILMLLRAFARPARIHFLDEFLNHLDEKNRILATELIREGAETVVFASHREIPGLEKSAVFELPSFGVKRFPAFTAMPIREGEIFQAENLDIFLGEKLILSDLSFTISSGDHLRIAGNNGSGKTTLLRLLHGDLSPAFGKSLVRFRYPGHETSVFRDDIYLLSAQAELLRYDMDLRQYILSGIDQSAGIYRDYSAQDAAAATELMAQNGLAPLAANPLSTLSTGQLRLANLLRGLMRPRRVWLLDEPWEGLDGDSRIHWRDIIQSLADNGATIVMTTHTESDIPDFLRREILLDQGRIVRDGPFSPEEKL